MSTLACDAATARELLGMLRQAASATTSRDVLDAVATDVAALHGDALGACLTLQTFAPQNLPPFEAELYAASVSIGAALWHVEQRTDATQALDAALAHLHAALDHHGHQAGVA